MKPPVSVNADFEILWNKVVSSDDFHPTCDTLKIRPSQMVRELEVLAQDYPYAVVDSIVDLSLIDMGEALRTVWELNNG